MAKYAEYIFNGTNYVQVGGSEGGSVTSRLVVTATGTPNNLTLSSTFSDILSAIQLGVDVVIKYSDYMFYLEFFDSSKIWFRRSDSFANMDNDHFEGLVMQRIVVTSNSAKIAGDTKRIPLVVTGNLVTDEVPSTGYYVDTDTTLQHLKDAIDNKMPIEIRVHANNTETLCFYFYEKGDGDHITFYKYTSIYDVEVISLTNFVLTPFSNNADGTLRCILRTQTTTLPSIPTVTTADSGKFLRVNSSGNWAAQAVPNAEEASF